MHAILNLQTLNPTGPEAAGMLSGEDTSTCSYIGCGNSTASCIGCCSGTCDNHTKSTF
ncbi:MAG: SapB/AmfS family lantipeptide [Gemmatimonas sp.]|jgi:hypothetical protein|nr:SapB/AmfS family lantipeptide [Gemmatimonas sp.]